MLGIDLRLYRHSPRRVGRRRSLRDPGSVGHRSPCHSQETFRASKWRFRHGMPRLYFLIPCFSISPSLAPASYQEETQRRDEVVDSGLRRE